MPIPGLNMSPYRIFAGLVLLLLLLQIISTGKIYITFEISLFISLLIVTSLLGLEAKNSSTFLTYIFMCALMVMIYNIFCNVRPGESEFLKLSVIINIIIFIGGITLITDYFGITKFSLIFGEEIFIESQIGRGSGILGGEANFTAARLCVLLPFGFYGVLNRSTTKLIKIFGIISIIVTIFAIIFTSSRMGYLALGQILLFIILREIKNTTLLRKFGIIMGFVVLIFISIYALSMMKNQEVTFDRMKSLTSISTYNSSSQSFKKIDKYVLERVLLLVVGVDLIKNNLLLGVGIGNSKYIAAKYLPYEVDKKYLHNTYLDIGSEHGIVLVGVLLLLLLLMMIKIYKRHRKNRRAEYFYFMLSFYILLFCWFFLSDFTNKFFWNLILPLGFYLEHHSIEKEFS
jgi:O-antigen ligase